MVELKYRSKRIGEMTISEISKWSKALLLKIHVITGWTVPNGSEIMNILVDQFEKKLIETFGELNPDEIEYAFRQKGTIVEDYGKSMNLNLLDKILLPYLNERFFISPVEENLATKPKQKIFTQEELDNTAREDAERQYQIFLKGNELRGLAINKPILEKDEMLLGDENVLDFFKRRKENGAKNIYVQQWNKQ